MPGERRLPASPQPARAAMHFGHWQSALCLPSFSSLLFMSDLWKLAHSWLRDLVSYEPGKPIEDVARELGLEPSQIIKLASNENPLGPSPKALVAMRETIERAHFYPDGGGYYLREAIAEKFGLERANVILGCGSNEVIEFIGKAFLQPGDEIITARHAFVVFRRENDRGPRPRLRARPRRDGGRDHAADARNLHCEPE
jgi:hypothetical protein